MREEVEERERERERERENEKDGGLKETTSGRFGITIENTDMTVTQNRSCHILNSTLLTLSPSLTHTHSFSHSLSLSHSLLLSRTHTHTLCLLLSRLYLYSLSDSIVPFLTLTLSQYGCHLPFV